MNDLFSLLRESGAGCCIDDYYAGVFGYADDLLLLSPSRDGLQKMLNIAQDYANEHKIAFSTDTNPQKSKTKGIMFSKEIPIDSPAPVYLNGDPLPWVSSGKYLGNKLTSVQDGYKQDVSEKRAMFITRNIELNQEFYFAHPAVKCRMNQIYNSSFSGSVLWNLKGEKTKQLVNSWSVAVRHMWNLPHNTHRMFIESLGGTHAEVMLYSRYTNFLQSIRKSGKLAATYLLEKTHADLTTMTGQNVRHFLDKTGERNIFRMKAKQVKLEFKFEDLPEDQEWKVRMMKEIVDVNHNTLVLTGDIEPDDQFSADELNEILCYLATS